jgi:hypothetical protein
MPKPQESLKIQGSRWKKEPKSPKPEPQLPLLLEYSDLAMMRRCVLAKRKQCVEENIVNYLDRIIARVDYIIKEQPTIIRCR